MITKRQRFSKFNLTLFLVYREFMSFQMFKFWGSFF